jgi:hypothetical protein
LLQGKQISRKNTTSTHVLSHLQTPQSSLNPSVCAVEMKRASGARSSIADSDIEYEVDRLAPKISPVKNRLISTDVL